MSCRLMGIHLFISIKLHYAVILALCQYEHLADQNWELLWYADYLWSDTTEQSLIGLELRGASEFTR